MNGPHSKRMKTESTNRVVLFIIKMMIKVVLRKRLTFMMDGILAKCHILISQSINSSIHNYINKQNANSSVINRVMHIIHMHFRSYQQFISTYRGLIYQLFTLLLWMVVDKC